MRIGKEEINRRISVAKKSQVTVMTEDFADCKKKIEVKKKEKHEHEGTAT